MMPTLNIRTLADAQAELEKVFPRAKSVTEIRVSAKTLADIKSMIVTPYGPLGKYIGIPLVVAEEVPDDVIIELNSAGQVLRIIKLERQF